MATFNPQPVLHGDGVWVRPLEPDDHDALFAVASDPLLWEQHPAHDRYRPEVFDAFFAEALRSGGALAVLTDAGELVGSSRFAGFDREASVVEIGWTFLARSHWGGATNRELKRLMVDHAFAAVARVIFRVGPENHRSQRAVQKLGARRRGSCRDGPGQVSVLFELTRD